jgi:hypothetical protein
MSQWDYDRMVAFLNGVSEQAASLAADLDSSNPKKFDLQAILHRVEQVYRDLNTTKTLLKRDRSKRA